MRDLRMTLYIKIIYSDFLQHVYQNILYCVLSQLSQNGHQKGFGYNIIIWLHFLFGFKSNMAECFCS